MKFEQQLRRLKVFPFVKPQCNWSADDDNRNLQYNQYISQTSCPAPGRIDIGSNVNMPEDESNFTNKDQKRHTFFVLAEAEAAGFDAALAFGGLKFGSKDCDEGKIFMNPLTWAVLGGAAPGTTVEVVASLSAASQS